MHPAYLLPFLRFFVRAALPRPAVPCGWLAPVLLLALMLPGGSPVWAQTPAVLLRQADNEPDSIKAIALYTRLIQQNQKDYLPPAYFGRAQVRGRAGFFRDAIRDASEAIRLKPGQADYFAQRAYLYVQLSEYDRAARDSRQAVTLAPAHANYYSTLSYIQTKQGRFAEAEATAQRGIDLDASQPYAYRNRGRARLYQKQPDQAIADFRAALARGHREPHRVYCDLGEAYRQKNQPAEALRYFTQSLTLRPDYADALVGRRQVQAQSSGGASVPVSPFSGRRVALVIGNTTYRHTNDLGGQPRNDARAMHRLLGGLGFAVDSVTDAGYATTTAALTRFYARAKGADVVLLFYAGHGIEHRGTNYLLPVDMNIDRSRPDSIETQAFSVNTLIDRLQTEQPRYFVMILDACRDDPFEPTPATPVVAVAPAAAAGAGPGRTAGKAAPDSGRTNRGGIVEVRGFRPVHIENKIPNCYLALATASGSTAGNGPNQHGFYTEALLKHLQRGRRLDDALRAVRSEVIKQTKNAQQPELVDRAAEMMIL